MRTFFCSHMDSDSANKFNTISPGIIIINELNFLGIPITENAFANTFNKKLDELKLLFERLTQLDNYHIAYYILKNCFSMPKLIFLLRTTPTCNQQEIIKEMDCRIKTTLDTLTNSRLENRAWNASSLPINLGGLGVRRIQDVALPAFLSSINCPFSLVDFMLQTPTLDTGRI